MPLQRVVERDALAHEALAVIDQQPQIELRALQPRRRPGIQTIAQRRPRDRNRVDAVGLPTPARAATRAGHELGQDAQNTLATRDQEALERARHVPTALQRPHPLAAHAPRPDQQPRESLGADLDRLLAQHLAGCR